MPQGFSLVEMLMVIAVIGIISALVLPQILDIKSGAQNSVARQQQAQIQTALDSWIAAESGKPGGLAAARALYSDANGAKLQLLQKYLQPSTYDGLSPSGNSVTSSALDSANAYLQFSEWPSGGQPTVDWINR